MKSSLKTLLTAAVLGLAVLPAISIAQPPGGGQGGRGGSPEQQIARLEEAVGSLTSDQKTKITAIYTKLTADMQAVPQEERREKGQALRTASQKEIRALLTADQQTKFDAMPQGRGPGGGQGRGPGGPGGPGGKKE